MKYAVLLAVAACGASAEVSVDGGVVTVDAYGYPEPQAWPPNHGPGGPTRVFTEAELFLECAYLDGGATDVDHHDVVVMVDGYLLLPWAPFDGGGGASLFDISDPCAPVLVGSGTSPTIRETHSIGFSDLGGRFMFVNAHVDLTHGGVETWDLGDPAHPAPVARLDLPGFYNDDGYARVGFSLFSQVPYLYVAAGDLGLFVIDAADPRAPRIVKQVMPEPILRAAQVQVVGNLLFISAVEGPRALLYDVSDPADPRPVPGGVFDIVDGTGQRREVYFSTFSGGYAYFTRKDAGGGIIIYDLHDPTRPTFAGDFLTNGNGGYVLIKDDLAFVGDSFYTTIYDVADPTRPRPIQSMGVKGDMDWLVPVGNVAVMSVDEGADPHQASTIFPWSLEPDHDPPRVTWVWPPPGASGLALTSRIGVTFSEMIDPASAWTGSVRLVRTDDRAPVDGWVSAQEHIVNFFPKAPLAPGTSYTLEIPAGGVVDYNGNAVNEGFTSTFTTAGR